MADPSQSLAVTGYSPADLYRPIFGSKVPYSEWAGRVRHGAELDTTRIENVVKAADYGIMWPLADMSRESLAMNPKAAGILNKGLLPLSAADWDLTPAEGDGIEPEEAKRIATKIRSIVQAIPGFKQALLDLAWGFWDGRSALEKQLVRRPTGTGYEVWCSSLDWIQPQRLSFEERRRLIVVDRWGDFGQFIRRGPVLDEVPGKFITFTPRLFGDLQEREGLAPRYLYWLLFDRMNWRQRFLVSEAFGIPWRMVETEITQQLAGLKMALPQRQDGGEGGAPGDDAAALEHAVREAANVVRDGIWAGLPGQKLSIAFPPESVREFFSQGSDQILERLAFLTLHNSLSAAAPDAEAGRAGAVVNLGGENTVLDFRGALVSEVVQRQLVDVLVELNHGAAALPLSPKFQLRTQPPRDRDKEVERAAKVSAMVPLGVGSIYEASGFRPPNPGEELVTPPAPPGGSGPFGEGGASPAALPEGEGGSEDATGALRDLVESADEDDQADAADAEADGQHLARWFADGSRKVAPATVHGSPEAIIERGVREAVRSTSAWADELVDACTGDDPARIYRNLAARAQTLDVEPFTRALERRLVHTLMLGALDADHEATNDVEIKPATFARLFDGAGRDFTALPFGEAIAAFNAKKVMSKRQFDRLAADAKRKAFTVAGLTTKRMLSTAHDELSKAITKGADLREFSKALGDRFDAAGWTRLNPSHVENVFRTNVMGAYADGRRAQMTQPHVLAARPYWQILGVDDARTRKTHAAAHGKVLPANDPFFASSGPPFGFQCRCRVISRSKRDLDRLGLTPTFGAALKGLPDPGWSADAIAPPASYEPDDGPPPKAQPGPATPKGSRFDELVSSAPIANVKAVSGDNVNPVFTARLGDVDVFMKPGHANLDPAAAVARHRAVAATTQALGGDALVMPAALVQSDVALADAAKELPALLDPKNAATAQMFVTQAAPHGAIPAYAQDPAALARVTEEARLTGAVVDLLHANTDRHDGNVLVDPLGHVVLIDHDEADATGTAASVFFPGGGLGYAGKQATLADLPERMRAHVSEIAGASADDLAERYGLSKEAAAGMKKRAQSIAKSGLDGALVQHGAYWQAVGPEARDRAGSVVNR